MQGARGCAGSPHCIPFLSPSRPQSALHVKVCENGSSVTNKLVLPAKLASWQLGQRYISWHRSCQQAKVHRSPDRDQVDAKLRELNDRMTLYLSLAARLCLQSELEQLAQHLSVQTLPVQVHQLQAQLPSQVQQQLQGVSH